MSSVNKVILVGRLGADPEQRYTPSGAAACNFTMATSEKWKGKDGQANERTEWHRIQVWGKLAEICAKYLAKGSQAYVEGRLQTRSWDDKDGNKRYTTEIVAQQVVFLGGGKRKEADSDPGGYGEPADPGGYGAPSGADDDIPF